MPSDKVLHKFISHEEARADTYRYWHSRSDAEVFRAPAVLSEAAYADYNKLRGLTPLAEGSACSLRRVQRVPR